MDWRWLITCNIWPLQMISISTNIAAKKYFIVFYRVKFYWSSLSFSESPLPISFWFSRLKKMCIVFFVEQNMRKYFSSPRLNLFVDFWRISLNEVEYKKINILWCCFLWKIFFGYEHRKLGACKFFRRNFRHGKFHRVKLCRTGNSW